MSVDSLGDNVLREHIFLEKLLPTLPINILFEAFLCQFACLLLCLIVFYQILNNVHEFEYGLNTINDPSYMKEKERQIWSCV